ncbi:MAG: hypothetical protein EPN91_07555 [Salinibacterium sp.]|nr:MAG: hypothetical protein EPN91_07555 [Salinibacterium sp.]
MGRQNHSHLGPNDDVTVAIHVLYYGHSLCALPGVPRDWPEGHKWTTIANAEHATCETCKEEALRIQSPVEASDASAARSNGT